MDNIRYMASELIQKLVFWKLNSGSTGKLKSEYLPFDSNAAGDLVALLLHIPVPSVYNIKFNYTLHKKWSFPLRISSVNVTKSAVTFTEEIFNGKLHFCALTVSVQFRD